MEKYSPGRKKPQHHKQRCHRCRGSGRVPCQFCSGSGQVRTGSDIFGNPTFSRCSACFGLKTTRCSHCGGEGFA